MNKNIDVRTFSGGMNKDVDYSAIPSNVYTHAENYKLVANDDSNGFILEVAEGNSKAIDLSTLTGLDTSYKLVAQEYIQPYLVLFLTTNIVTTYPNTGTSAIVRLTIDKDYIQSADVIYQDSAALGRLNLSSTYPIKTTSVYESSDIVKVYW